MYTLWKRVHSFWRHKPTDAAAPTPTQLRSPTQKSPDRNEVREHTVETKGRSLSRRPSLVSIRK